MVEYAGGTRRRQVVFPHALLPVFTAGVRECGDEEYILAGARPGAPLADRTAERMIRRAAAEAKIGKPVLVAP